MKEWYGRTGRRITFEYSCVEGENTSPEDAQLLETYRALPLEIRRAVDGLMAPYRHDETKEKTGS